MGSELRIVTIFPKIKISLIKHALKLVLQMMLSEVIHVRAR